MELGTSLGLEILKDLISEFLRIKIEEYVEKQVRETRSIGSLIYFTIFNPRVSAIDINEFLENLVMSVGQKVPKESPWHIHLLVGRSQLIINAYITKLSDILFYEAMYRELVDALEGDEQYEDNAVENRDLAHEFGLEDSRVLEKISDITIVIFPLGKPRIEDIRKLIQAIYDKGAQDLGTDRAVVKIAIYAPLRSKDLNDIEKKLRNLRVRVYRSSNNVEKLIAILSTPGQILSDEVYRAIYGGINWLSSLRSPSY
jgi:hypothetical protein